MVASSATRWTQLLIKYRTLIVVERLKKDFRFKNPSSYNNHHNINTVFGKWSSTLRQFKASVTTDAVAKLLSECPLLIIVG